MKKMIMALFLFGYSLSVFALNVDEVWARFDIIHLQLQDIYLKIAPHTIGESYHGGIIFWLDKNGHHGLVASKKDIGMREGIQWRNGNSGSKVTNARGNGIGAGESNTRLIIAQQTIDQQTGNFAALIAANYHVMEDGKTPCPNHVSVESDICFGGWYLPSLYELELLRKNLGVKELASFTPDYYWSSTESSASTAFMESFPQGEVIESNKSNTMGQVRAIARF